MYAIKGIKFHVDQRVEENLKASEPEIYQKLQCFKIKDESLWMGYDDIIKLFRPEYPYGQTLEEKTNKL